MKSLALSILRVSSVLVITSCGSSFSSEVGDMADGVCECVGENYSEDFAKECLFKVVTSSKKYEEFGDDIDAAQAFSMEVQDALKDKCPEVYTVLKD